MLYFVLVAMSAMKRRHNTSLRLHIINICINVPSRKDEWTLFGNGTLKMVDLVSIASRFEKIRQYVIR
jgi:hypothetical protein